MKKKMISLALALTVAAGVCSVAGCKEENDASDANTVTIYDFERGTFGVGMANTFGKIELNKDRDYVSSGKYSLKLLPSNENSLTPYMYLSFSSSTLGFGYNDVTKLESVNFKIYATAESKVSAGLYFSAAAEVKSIPSEFTLKEGWNEIAYKPDYSLISVQATLTDCRGVYLMFDGAGERIPVAYLDDVSLTHNEAFTWDKVDLIHLKRTDSYFEICDFENAYQNLVFSAYGSSGTFAPELTVVNADDYEGVSATSGSKVLKLQLYPKDNANESTWTQIRICAPLLEAIDFKQFASEIDSYRFCMDVYQYGDDNDQRTLNGNKNLIELNLFPNKGDMNWGGLTTERGKWTSVSYPLTQFRQFVSNPKDFMFAFLDPYQEGEYVWFFDNLRIEKIG